MNKSEDIILVDIPEGQIVIKRSGPTIKDTLTWREYQDNNKNRSNKP